MATVVVKLGSSIVADPRGEVRTEVIDPLCAEVAARHHAGDSVVMVTSGAIARGMRIMNLPARPAAMDELQAASAVGQGPLYQVYEGLLAQRDVPSAQVLLTFFDMSARSHYVNARLTLSRLLEWRVVPVINENDTTTTDEISFGDNDFLAAQVAILLGAERLVLLTDTDGLYTADPARGPRGRAGHRRDLVRAAGVAGDRLLGLAAGVRRHALQGGGRRDGHRGRHPRDHRPRDRRRPGAGRAGRPARRYPLPPARRARVLVQALAQVREAGAGGDLGGRRAPPAR